MDPPPGDGVVDNTPALPFPISREISAADQSLIG
jgi:hypothetical protein